jgi:hypothetical protein
MVGFFTTDLFLPRYRDMASGGWSLEVRHNGLAKGYWSPAVIVPELPMLSRGRDVWMSVTPLEVESAEIGIRQSRGHVLVMGLGMGWAAMATAIRDEVAAVTVVEQDPEVIALHRELDLFAQLPDAARAKLRIVEGDAYTYRPDTPVDLLMPDIWLPLINDGRVDEVRRMQDNARGSEVYFWGQELAIARHARAAGREFDAGGVAATIADFGLPLIGPIYANYPALIAAAADNWMRGRWL